MNGSTRFRYGLKRLLCPLVVPILGGPVQGSWFGLFTGARFIRGNYGRDEVPIFERLLTPASVVLDVGAHVGYFTLLASRAVGPRGKVIAFEPLPVNLAYLRMHCRVNRLSNARVVPAAVGGEEGQMSLDCRGGTGRGRLSTTNGDGLSRVRVVTLDAMFQRGDLPPVDLIKMDVEGAECEALRGARQLLSRCRPAIILSVHGPAAKRDCQALLEGLGYRQTEVRRSLLVAISPEHQAEARDLDELRRAA